MTDLDPIQIRRRLAALAKRQWPVPHPDGQARSWEFASPIPESAVLTFEQTTGCTLPPDFRWFITHVGNGGPGPGSGLLPLPTENAETKGLSDLGRPFPHVAAMERPPWRTLNRGVLPLCDHGCGLGDLLVVSGPARGQVWWDAVADDDGVGPHFDDGGTPVGFQAWWLAWLQEQEAQIERQYVVPPRFSGIQDEFAELVHRIRVALLSPLRTTLEDLQRTLKPGVLVDLVDAVVDGTQIERGRVHLGPALDWRGTTLSLGPQVMVALAHLNQLVPGVPKAEALASDIRALEVDDEMLSAAGRLDGLRTLSLLERRGDPPLRDLTVLRGTPALTTLTTKGLDTLTSTSGIEQCPHLRTVDLTDCGSVVTLAGIEQLTCLEALNLRGCTAVESLSPLRGLAALTRLHLSQVGLSSLDGLPAHLTHLNLADWSELRSASALSSATDLQDLSLSGCYGIENFAFLRALANLNTLSLRETTFAQPDALLASPNLESLDLSWCEGLQDLSALAGLKRLRVLRLAGLTVDARLFLELPALEVLDLQNARVTSLKTLDAHPTLRVVRLDGSPSRKPPGWRF
ncbi:MAG: leucine-rich repeat domain-containing protein [Myxococcota bacterium]